ncbi:MAG TPA: polysaccharide deacetylase family protein [Candidatus Binatia bacterium]
MNPGQAAARERPPAIVLGGGHNALGVFRSLGRKGVKVVAVHTNAGDAALLSKYCSAVVPPRGPAAGGDAYVDFLMNLPSLGTSSAVLIPTGDSEAALVSRHRGRLQSRFRFVMPDEAVIESLIDKRLFSRLAATHGVAVPRTYVVDDASALEAAARELAYPCVLKPARSAAWGEAEFQRRFGAGAGGWIKRIVVRSAAELGEIYPEIARFAPGLIVQEYIEGGDDALYDFYSYLDAGSEPVGTFMIRKQRTLPIDGNGIGTCVESVWVEDLAETALRFLKAIRYRGNSAVSFKRCARTGCFYVIEVNARLALHHSLATHCGVDLAYMAYLEAAGEKLEPVAPQRRTVKWLSFWDDFAAFRRYRKRGDITLGAWIASLRGEKAHCFFAPDDPRPFALKTGEALLVETLGRERVRSLLGGARRLAIQAGYYTGALSALGRLQRQKKPRLVILMYHSVGGSALVPPALSVSKKNFAGQLRYLKRHFELISLERAVELIEAGEPPTHDMAAVTFDDGFHDNYETAFPILRRYRCPATIFVATGPIAGGDPLWPMKLYLWFKNTRARRCELPPEESPAGAPRVFELGTDRERRAALKAAETLLCRSGLSERDRMLAEIAGKLGFAPADGPSAGPAMLTWAELREMADAGVTIGSHTVSHPSLSALGRSEALAELADSKASLESHLGRPVRFFAYPFGELEHFNAEVQSLVGAAGYDAACTAVRGANEPSTDRFGLFRVGVLDDPPAVFAFKLAGVR